MGALITKENDEFLLNPVASAQIAEFERRIKELKEAEDALRQRVLEEMEQNGIKTIKTPEMTISYKAPYDKETFQTKDFRSEHPDLFDQYVKMSPCKASISIRMKEEKE